ncbi:MAG: heavy metal-binding domain-containing protein [Ignavibacteriaceae bacterium]
MKTKTGIKLFIILITAVLITGCGKSGEEETMDMQTRGRDVDSTFIRDYSVDVASLDANGDGSVYQCPMDWNIISDDAGSCPVCMMDLEEYSVSVAQQNLEDNSPDR